MKKLVHKLKTFLGRYSELGKKNKSDDFFNNSMAWPVGHFYSPLPQIEEIKKMEEKIFSTPKEIPGIKLNIEEQFQILNDLKKFYPDIPFTDSKQNKLRYYYINPNYSYGEAIILFCMIRYLKPKRIIEIGAGYTSCAMLDTNEMFFNNAIDITILEPYPELLLNLVKDEKNKNFKLLTDKVQNTDKELFTSLTSNDILFIDSSHVCKVNSDVNFLFSKILPALDSGVYVHFHDIYYPFEYPKEWIYKGIAWNEAYMLRSFLQFNNTFSISFFNSFLAKFYSKNFAESMPLFLKNPGSSIWIKKS